MAEEKNNQAKDHGEIFASWEFPEFIKYKRTKLWYTIALLVVLGLTIFALFTKSYVLLIIIVLIIMIILARARREPHLLTVNITEDGVAIGRNTFYEWKDIKNFWIVYEPPEVKNLYFDFKTGIRPSVAIHLGEQNPLGIRSTLLKYITEDISKENESFSDALMRILKL